MPCVAYNLCLLSLWEWPLDVCSLHAEATVWVMGGEVWKALEATGFCVDSCTQGSSQTLSSTDL